MGAYLVRHAGAIAIRTITLDSYCVFVDHVMYYFTFMYQLCVAVN